MRKMKKNKKTLIAGLITLMIGVTGCMSSSEKKNEEMLEHMQEKYGVEFEIQSYIPRSYACSYDVWFCNAVGDDPEMDKIEVHRYYGDKAKDREYEDKYYSRMMRDEVERRAMEALEKVTDEAKAYISSLSFAGEEYKEPDQLDEFLQTEEGNRAFGMIVFILDKEKDGIMNQDVVNKIVEVVPDAGIGDQWFRIIFVGDEATYKQIERNNCSDMIFLGNKENKFTGDYAGTADIGITE